MLFARKHIYYMILCLTMRSIINKQAYLFVVYFTTDSDYRPVVSKGRLLYRPSVFLSHCLGFLACVFFSPRVLGCWPIYPIPNLEDQCITLCLGALL